jgi:hypothetical protein
VAKRDVHIVADPPADPLWDAVMARLREAEAAGEGAPAEGTSAESSS